MYFLRSAQKEKGKEKEKKDKLKVRIKQMESRQPPEIPKIN